MEDYEGFGASEVLVKNVMSENPLIIKEDEKIKRAANLMSEAKTGSLVVLDSQGELSGILTEMDIVDDLVSQGLDADEVLVKDIMSSPVHTIESSMPIQEAAKTMADLKIRRLPVVEGEEMVGIITENDILEISPTLIDITREYKKIRDPGDDREYRETYTRETSGYCESCGVYSEQLTLENGRLLCPECE
ncbi:MAG: cyclic nucleotide-binding/CBS domain-containing protein [Candidatus Natronoplasma sp.]